MKNSSRLGDSSTHGGAIVTASMNTFINNIPATRLADILACPIHGPNPVVFGAMHCFINNRMAARLGDPCACGAALFFKLSPNTFVGDM